MSKEKNNITFMMALFALFIFGGVMFAQSVSAINLHVTNANNGTLAFSVLAGGNVTINITTSNQSNAQTPNGGHAANVSLYHFCERQSTPTHITSRLNTSTNQTTFSFGINISSFEDCNRTILVRAFNDTAGATVIHVGGEDNTSDVYYNTTTLTQTFITADKTTQTSENQSFALVSRTSEQAANVTMIINNQRVTMFRTNSSGVRWTGSLINIPEGTYTYTLESRDLANDLKTATQTITVEKSGGGGKFGAFGKPKSGGKVVQTTTQESKNNTTMVVIVIAIVAFLLMRR